MSHDWPEWRCPTSDIWFPSPTGHCYAAANGRHSKCYAFTTPCAEPWLSAALQPCSHIVIDVFTHSSEYYPSPVLYPITDRGFDGIAWPTSWFMALNYAALGIAGLWLWRSARKDNPVNTQAS